MTKKTLCVLVLLCASRAVAQPAAPDPKPDKPVRKPSKYTGPKVTLKVRFKPGSYALTETLSMKMAMKMIVGDQAQPMKITMDTTVGGDLDISKPNAAGEQDVRFVCRTVRMGMAMLGMTMSYDSEGPAEKQTPELVKALKPIVGMSVTLTGKDGKWKNVPQALESVLAKVASTPQMRQQVKGMMEPFMKEMLTKHWAKMLPTKPVGPGDEWTAKMEVTSVPVLGKMDFNAQCLLQDVEKTPDGTIALIDFVVKAGVTDRAVTPADGAATPMKMKIEKLDAHVMGTARFNMDVGLSTGVLLNQDLKAKMSAAGPNGQKANIELEAKVQYTNTLRVVK